jgi:hypothetical protein
MTFCTLFNSKFLLKGLAMIFSLKEHAPESKIYVLCMDELTFDFFKKNHLEFEVIPINLTEFENNTLLELKKNRTFVEYCWTLTPCLIEYCLKKFNLHDCTYLDADLFFFSSPKKILDRIGNNSVLITEHNYYPKYDQSKMSGIYCVQFMYFKNDSQGNEVLSWWKDKCLDWCFARFEEDRFGDQKYLDNWPNIFKSVKVHDYNIQCLAPWNIQNYFNEKYFDDTVFYHFHFFDILSKSQIDIGFYQLNNDVVKTIYYPYLQKLLKINHTYLKYNLLETSIRAKRFGIFEILKRIIKKTNNRINIYGKNFRYSKIF